MSLPNRTPALLTRGDQPHRVVVVGGGFAGLQAVRALRRAPVEVTLVDRRNFHLFQPLLYQVATGALTAGEIATPLRGLLKRQRNARVVLGDVRGFDLRERRVLLAEDAIGYDSLVVAAGAGHAYFGHDEWQASAPGLKTLEDAIEIRRRILGAFEAAELEVDDARRRAWLTFVVVGGGPTGVELAGQIAEIARDTLRRDFRDIDPRVARILLVEAEDRLLGGFPEPLVLVLGDMVRVHDAAGDDRALPGVAPVAMQQGRYAAKAIRARLKGREPGPFHYLDKGNVATIGRLKAVADVRGVRVSGTLAWLIWLFVHLFYLVGLQNRILVIIRWSVSFVTRGRGARLITGGDAEAAAPASDVRPPLRAA